MAGRVSNEARYNFRLRAHTTHLNFHISLWNAQMDVQVSGPPTWTSIYHLGMHKLCTNSSTHHALKPSYITLGCEKYTTHHPQENPHITLDCTNYVHIAPHTTNLSLHISPWNAKNTPRTRPLGHPYTTLECTICSTHHPL